MSTPDVADLDAMIRRQAVIDLRVEITGVLRDLRLLVERHPVVLPHAVNPSNSRPLSGGEICSMLEAELLKAMTPSCEARALRTFMDEHRDFRTMLDKLRGSAGDGE